ncbi:hypothetical protein pkur_cds_542 [Pandoravirus kuranda]|uniref:F-box domain-containing protein n=2 Tax=Pandoravirus TaxID=2060084 RepID=A0AA95J7U1_9VIRU|nr:hypothetical protein pneo_cds_578 [Pandoravirus neocaledonia]AVK76185.1 hypothetical protein pneo_cds_578 [Pandoravirus neocaledonia]WBR14716.1 hypothetical protein pkur_cds_542 [Pandoravirus kuranda]
MQTTIHNIPHDVIAHIVSYTDHVTLRALRMASALFHVSSIPDTAAVHVAHYAERVRHTTLLNLAAAAVVASVPVDAPLPYSRLPRDLHRIVGLHRLFWLSRQPCTPLARSAAAHAASLVGIGRGPCRCLCQVWDVLYRALCSL